MADKAPLTQKLEADVPAAAAGDAQDTVVGEAPFAGTVEGVSFTPEANITGDTTNTRTLTLVNKGADGNGSTTVATLAFTTGVNASDFDEKALTLTATVADRDVAAGDILALVETVGGTGLANPGGHAQVAVGRD